VTAVEAMVGALFANPDLTRQVTYTPLTGTPKVIRVVLKSPDTVTMLGEAALHSATLLVDVRVSDVPQPQAGDTIIIGGVTHTVQGEPLADRERLVWTLDCA
jgi:hypothetical protein